MSLTARQSRLLDFKVHGGDKGLLPSREQIYIQSDRTTPYDASKSDRVRFVIPIASDTGLDGKSVRFYFQVASSSQWLLFPNGLAPFASRINIRGNRNQLIQDISMSDKMQHLIRITQCPEDWIDNNGQSLALTRSGKYPAIYDATTTGGVYNPYHVGAAKNGTSTNGYALKDCDDSLLVQQNFSSANGAVFECVFDLATFLTASQSLIVSAFGPLTIEITLNQAASCMSYLPLLDPTGTVTPGTSLAPVQSSPNYTIQRAWLVGDMYHLSEGVQQAIAQAVSSPSGLKMVIPHYATFSVPVPVGTTRQDFQFQYGMKNWNSSFFWIQRTADEFALRDPKTHLYPATNIKDWQYRLAGGSKLFPNLPVDNTAQSYANFEKAYNRDHDISCNSISYNKWITECSMFGLCMQSNADSNQTGINTTGPNQQIVLRVNFAEVGSGNGATTVPMNLYQVFYHDLIITIDSTGKIENSFV